MDRRPLILIVLSVTPLLGGAIGLATLTACSFAPIDARCGAVAAAQPARPAPDFAPFHTLPRKRLGCLPFPGPFTIYTAADPADLGVHSYSGKTAPGETAEVERGIVYTRRAGFLDICHVRITADFVAYIHARLRHAIDREWSCLRFNAHEPSIYTVRLTYPEGWSNMPAPDRDALANELAIRTAQRLANTVMTWHEIATWYGYKSSVVVPEDGSAFTHEDSASHALGALVGGAALRSDEPFDHAVTRLLDAALARLDVTDVETQHAAIDAVEGEWWSSGRPLVRHTDVGLADGAVTPWTLDHPELGPGAEGAVVFDLPRIDYVLGVDCLGFARVSIEPRVLESWAIRGRIPGDPEAIVPERDFPHLLADVRADADDRSDVAAAADRAATPLRDAERGLTLRGSRVIFGAESIEAPELAAARR